MTSKSPASSIHIDSYQLLERVGEGATAHVHRAKAADGQIVAIKLLAPQAELDDETARLRFEREICALAGVHHPNLIELLDHGVDEEFGPYLVTPLYTGKTLRDLVAGAALCPEAMVLLISPVLDALAALHEAGIVHRDVKPENVLATPDGRIVLVDLGLAFEAGQTRYTDDGAVVGSVPYMAPEQIEGGQISAATDVWAAGVMAYELCAGTRPFERDRSSEEAAAILVGAFAALDSVQRKAGPEHSKVIAQCLQSDMVARPAASAVAGSMRGLIDWFDAHGAATEVAAVVADPTGYQARIAELRATRIARAAERALDGGEPFAALKLLDRGLAYAPDDPALRELCVRAEKVSGAASSIAVAPASSNTRHWTRRRVAQYVGGGVVAALAVVAAVILAGGSDNRSQPETTATTTAATAGQTLLGEPVAKGSNTEKALDVFGGMLDLMNEGVTAKERAAGLGKRAHDPKKADDAALRVMGGMFSLLKRSAAADTATAERSAGAVAVLPIPAAALSNGDPRLPVDLAASPGTQLIARSYLAGKTPAQRIVEVEAEVARDPTDAGWLMNRAMVYLAAGRRAAGLAHLADALSRKPTSVILWAAKGYVELRRGNYSAAESALSKAIALDPSATNALRNRGILRRRLGRTRDAYADLTGTLSAKPNDVEAMAELILIYRQVGRATDAQPLLDRACTLGKTAACSAR